MKKIYVSWMMDPLTLLFNPSVRVWKWNCGRVAGSNSEIFWRLCTVGRSCCFVALRKQASGRQGVTWGCLAPNPSVRSSVCPSINTYAGWPKPERVPRNTRFTHVNLKALVAHVFPLCYLTSSTPSNTYGRRTPGIRHITACVIIPAGAASLLRAN